MSSSRQWPRMALREAGVTLIDCDHRTPQAREDGYPYIAIPQIKDGHIRLDGSERKISTEDFVEWTKKLKPQEHDVIVVRRCSSGDSAVVPRDLECAVGQNLVVLRADGRYVYPPFLRWLLRSDDWWEQVRKYINVGAVFDSLKCREIPSFELPISPLAVQKEIAVTLGAIDDRIALLRETNATLEAIAQALFKSWFVDFDPVHARARGEQPAGLTPEVAALFPDSFEESALGMIPRGWKLMQFGEFIDRQSVGKKYDQKSALEEGSVPILDQGKSGVIGFHNDKPSVCASLVSPVVVFANHTCYMRLITFDFSAIQNVLPFIGKGVDTVWAFYATKDRVKFSEYKGHWPEFVIQKTIVPNQELTEIFRNMVDPLICSMRNNELQAQTLANLRDTLLPRLISGQLRLPEAEAMVEGAS